VTYIIDFSPLCELTREASRVEGGVSQITRKVGLSTRRRITEYAVPLLPTSNGSDDNL
jgi:hypothetical protein